MDLAKPVLYGGTALRAGLFNVSIGLAQQRGFAGGQGVLVVVPVIPALVIGQRDVHVRHIVHYGRQHVVVLLCRVGDAAFPVGALPGLVEGVQQQRKERQVVAERRGGQKAVSFAQVPAQAAVHRLEALLSRFGKRVQIGNDVAEQDRASPFVSSIIAF